MHLPPGYVERAEPEDFADHEQAMVHQPDVYALAGFLAERSAARWIVDIGSGSAGKLRPYSGRFGLICIDREETIARVKRSGLEAEFIAWDLESGLPGIDPEILSSAVVVCADVIEHLRCPDAMSAALARVAGITPFVLLSTPDRDRARGWLDLGPPANASHAREWSAAEFVRYLSGAGFAHTDIHGHTVNNNLHRAKTTTLVVAGVHARRPRRGAGARVAAVMHVFNEVDILEETARHLASQGIETHVFDNWSDDGSWPLAQKLVDDKVLAAAQRFPECATDEYQWARMLAKTEEYAAALDADWVMHHDADELRYAPWGGVTLAEGFAHVESLGYNAVDFTVLDFRFLESMPESRAPFERALTFFEFGRRPGHFLQIKAWKNRCRAGLVDSGGHEAAFPDRRVFPLKFLTKHYPLRSIAQAHRKVFRDRIPRTRHENQSRGWHSQYDAFIKTGAVPGWQPHALQAWHPCLFETEYVVERISGLGLVCSPAGLS